LLYDSGNSNWGSVITQGGGNGLPCPPPGDLPKPGIEPKSPILQADSLPFEPPGKPSLELAGEEIADGF